MKKRQGQSQAATSSSSSRRYVEVDKIAGSKKIANVRYYGLVFADRLANGRVSVRDRTAVRMIQDILMMNVSIDLYRQNFEPIDFPIGNIRFRIPDDFGDDDIDLISEYVKRTSHPVIKARLAHLVWFLEPRRRATGFVALNAYISVLEGIDKNKYCVTDDYRNSNFIIVEYFCSAFRVMFGLSYPTRQKKAFSKLIGKFIKKVAKDGDLFALFRLIEIMLSYSNMDFDIVIKVLIKYAKNKEGNVSIDQQAYIWMLLARVYEKNRKTDKSIKCMKNAVDTYINLSNDSINSGRMTEAVVWLNLAIYSYKFYSDSRYADLYPNLRSIEEYIPSELSSFYCSDVTSLDQSSLEIDISNITLLDALYQFTILTRSPDSRNLRKQAKAITKSCPVLLRLDPDVKSSSDNKVVLSYSSDISEDSTFEKQIYLIEHIRRFTFVKGRLIYYNRIIGFQKRISKFDLIDVIGRSPVVPSSLVTTFADGFDRYFKGDMISAFYILTPLLERIMRQALLISGHDVTRYTRQIRVKEDHTISSMLRLKRKEVEGIFGPEIVDDIERVFLAPGGPCLRHGLAHADLSDSVPGSDDAIYAMWLIWRLIALPLVPRWSEIFSQ